MLAQITSWSIIARVVFQELAKKLLDSVRMRCAISHFQGQSCVSMCAHLISHPIIVYPPDTAFFVTLFVVLLTTFVPVFTVSVIIPLLTSQISHAQLVSRFQRRDTALDQCTICIENIRAIVAIKLPCAHIFHRRCIRVWVNTARHPSCPTCRAVLLIED
eukprot:IDg5476t1